MAASAPTKIGRYDVLGALGQGGMGVVYLANDPLLGRKVAVKTILASNFATEDQDDLLRRLLQEGQKAANLRHPGIVSVLDAMQTGDETYIVMEYVAGGKLSDRLKERPDHETTLRILREIAQALDYAHQQGIVHRDIKPDNILLDAGDTVRIADFGIAKSLSRHSISVGAVGTPHYMAPEQIQNEDNIDGKADQFSLGVIAYSMLTGKRPFEGKSQASTPFAIQKKIVNEDPPNASKVEKSLPPEVDSVLLTALAKNPKQRYPTCMAFVEDLERAIDGSKPVGQGSGWPVPRWLTIAAIALLAVGVGYGLFHFVIGPVFDPPTFKLVVDSRGAPLESGAHFPAGDASAPNAGDLSARVIPDRSVSSSWHGELALLEDGRVVDHADVPSDPAGMNHTFAFASPLPPGEYAVRFNIGGVQKGNLGFVIDAPVTPAAPSLSLQIRVMGNLVAEGQKLNKRDPEYPKPGFIGPNDITATVVSTAVPPIASGTPVRLEWLKDGVSLAPAVDVTADDIGKALPFSTNPKGPDPGNYSAKLTVDGQDTLVNFTIVGAPPPIVPGPAEKKQPSDMHGLLTFEIWSRTCRLTSDQHIKADDEVCGQLGSGDLFARISQKTPVPSGFAVELVWSVDEKETDRQSLSPDNIATRKAYRNIAEPGRYRVQLLVNHSVQAELKFSIDK